MAPMSPNLTPDGDLSFEKSPLVFYVNGKKVSNFLFFAYDCDKINHIIFL